MMKKNDLLTIDIETITNEGNGIGRQDGMAVFVPMTAPAERALVRVVKVQKSFCYGIVEELLAPSPERIDPDCPVFHRCGGCSLRHLTYGCELAAKQQWVTDAVRRLGGLATPILPILPSPKENGYRNKAQYPFGTGPDGKTTCGFFAPRTHTIIPAMGCRLQPAFFGDICRTVCQHIDRTGGGVYDEATGRGLYRHLYLRHGEATGQMMVCLVVNGQSVPEPQVLIDSLRDCCPTVASILLNHNTQNTNVILGSKTTVLWGKETITDCLCGVEIDLSPLSFYQVNRLGAQQLYGVAGALAALTDGELLLDLYCGAGTIGLALIKDKPNAHLIGVEIVESAVENARENARRAGIQNARFLAGDAGTAAAKLAVEGLSPAVIIVDPPRKGCDEATLTAIAKMSPKRLVMVSCNPATMARDMKLLAGLGYTPTTVQPVDMFPRTNHVECCVLLSHKNS